MAWIKRNLFFLIGSLIAVGLMVVGIIYLLGQINAENQYTEEIQKHYVELSDLAKQNPHPGNDKVDNVKAAREQEQTLRQFILKERGFFQHISSIPDSANGKISTAAFASELYNTIADLRRAARQQSVELPPDYYFTFEAQKKSTVFEAGSLESYASHLGEIKALCDVLFTAKINLDGIQREIISTNQDTNPSDYLNRKTVSTPLADLTPYQITFHCFSAELAQLLTSLATSPFGFMVESINVEPLAAMAETSPGGLPPGVFAPPSPTPGTPGFNRGRPGFIPPPVAGPATPVPAGRSAEFLKEKAFRVTLMIELVKPKPEAKTK